jgi:hypothetical protein
VGVQHCYRNPELRNCAIEAFLHLATNPPSLCHLARRVVRQQLWLHTGGASIIAAVFQLHYPLLLKQYLLLSDVRSCDIDHMPPHHCHFNCTKPEEDKASALTCIVKSIIALTIMNARQVSVLAVMLLLKLQMMINVCMSSTCVMTTRLWQAR